MRRLSTVLPLAFAASRRTVYSDKVLDHYRNPRNVGKLDDKQPDVGSATVGALECGDLMNMSLKINPETQVIEDVKFKTFGCGSAIASSSYASVVIRGKTIAQALELTNKDIAAELSLPPVKLHCSMLAEETIRAAISNYLQKQPQLKVKVKRNTAAAAEGEQQQVAAGAH